MATTNQDKIRYMSIATLVMLGIIGALCIATSAMTEENDISGCEELDQHLLGLYDHDHNGLINKTEMECAGLDYEDNRMLQSEYVQLRYAYEHQCSVISGGGGGGGGGATYPPGWGNCTPVVLLLCPGWNLIAIPVNDPTADTAAELASMIDGCKEIVRWDVLNQTYDPYTKIGDDWAGTDFNITTSMGIFVNVEDATDVGFTDGTC